VATRFPLDLERLERMSIVEGKPSESIRMAHLAVVGTAATNGVAVIHTHLLTEKVLRDFAELWPAKFTNKTNGITPRRWLLKANPGLAALITEVIGDAWITDLDQLQRLAPLADDAAFRERFRAVKQHNKAALARLIRHELGLEVSSESLFDVQVKRLHEYKRQLLLLLYTIIRYLRLRDAPERQMSSRVVIFGAKAAPGYTMSKLIIKLIHQVAEVVNGDPLIGSRLQVAFLPNYRVSLAERIIPAANLSEQISLAGTEASGTGNMKLQLNGALTIGTLDGATVEIREEVGPDSIFIFGMTTDEVEQRRCGYQPRDIYHQDGEVRRAIDLIARDFFSLLEPGIVEPIIRSLLDEGDRYMLLADLRSYDEAQERVDQAYRDPAAWDRMAILNVARSGRFSSDRTIREYAEEIWKLQPWPDGVEE
jgi:starch phosphorylase